MSLARAILIGLEFLVAGDIIATISTSVSLESLYQLGLVVLIRTFLSFSLEVETEGRFPWQRPPIAHEKKHDDAIPVGIN